MSEEAVVDISRDACLTGYGEYDTRVTLSAEDAGVLALQGTRFPNEQKEVVRLYDELRPSLYAYLSTLGLFASEAEEVIQEGFFRLVRDLSSGNEVRNLRGWLFRVTHNLAMDVYRTMDRDGVVAAEDHSPLIREQVDPDPDPEEAYSQEEKRMRVNSAIQNLTSQQRRCLLLRSEGMSYCDIGMTLSISTQRAAFLVQRSLVLLADLCD